MREKYESIADKEREIQQLRRELEQTTLRVNEREQTIETLEQQLKKIQLGPSPIDQRAKFSADMKLVWRKGKPAPKAIY